MIIKRSPIIEKNLSIVIFTIMTSLSLISCANMGVGPQGGPRDIRPPRPLKSNPPKDALNYKNNKVEVVFDEIIQVEKAFDNVVISPPQTKAPIVKAVGRKLIVELKDTILDNTTYTIDFGQAIVDNNEKNPLTNYSFSFSTGDHIDSLKISGTVIDASNLNPVQGIIVGIHSDLSDSIFQKKAFDRISKTDNKGRFTIKNIKEGSYRIYALKDVGNNYLFDFPNEEIAFDKQVITPTFSINLLSDTTFRDSIDNGDTIRLVDTIVTYSKTVFSPDSIILKTFEKEAAIQYLSKSRRADSIHFSLYFNDKNETLPEIRSLDIPMENKYLIQTNEYKDTITYWITDSILWHRDTLHLEVKYYKTDTLNNLVQQVDTLHLSVKGPGNKKKNALQKEKIEFLPVNTNILGTFNYFDTIKLNFSAPTYIDTTRSISLKTVVDTIHKEQDFVIKRGDSIGIQYVIISELKAGGHYILDVDSAYFYDLYGRHNDNFTTKFTCKPTRSYTSITLEMGLVTGKEVVQLLDKNDRVLKSKRLNQNKIKFDLLNPGVYYARLFVDENENGIWDPGDFNTGVQPEAVYYYPYYLQLREMWDAEEYWDYLEFPLLEQKPKELIKTDSKTNK